MCLFFPVTRRLFDRWTVVQNADQSPDGEEEKEVIDSSVLRLLTKEYVEVLQRLLERSAGNDPTFSTNEDQMDMDDSEMGGDDGESSLRPAKTRNSNQQGCVNELGDVGLVLLKDPECFQWIIHLCAV
jgi:hypothetical protein